MVPRAGGQPIGSSPSLTRRVFGGSGDVVCVRRFWEPGAGGQRSRLRGSDGV